MHSSIRLLVSAVLGLTCLTRVFAAENSAAAIEKQVLATHDAMIAAAEALDLGRLYDFVLDADTIALVVNGRLLRTKTEAEANSQDGFQGIATIKYVIAERHVTVLSPDAALLVADGTAEVAMVNGRTISAPFIQTNVLVLQDGEWRVLHTHQSTPVEQRG